MKRNYMVFVLIACLMSILSACGQSGNLYLPEKPEKPTLTQ